VEADALRSAGSFVVAAAALLAPKAALACPYCAGRADGGIGQALALVLFVMFPFAVALVVARIVRSGDRPALSGDTPHPGPTRREAE
jgi:hypothetical protein